MNEFTLTNPSKMQEKCIHVSDNNRHYQQLNSSNKLYTLLELIVAMRKSLDICNFHT
jgi:hypothetical protein